MRSLTIFLGLILLTACKQFTLSEEDKKILAESDRLMEDQRELVESTFAHIIPGVNDKVQKTGNRPDDIQLVSQLLRIWKKYDSTIYQVNSSFLEDSPFNVNFYDNNDYANLDDAVLYQIQYPLRNKLIRNESHLKLELAYNLDDILYNLSLRVFPDCMRFDVFQVAIVSDRHRCLIFLKTDDADMLIKSIEGSSAVIDDIKLKYNWTSKTNNDDLDTSVEYFNNGKLETLKFNEMSIIQVLGQ